MCKRPSGTLISASARSLYRDWWGARPWRSTLMPFSPFYDGAWLGVNLETRPSLKLECATNYCANGAATPLPKPKSLGTGMVPETAPDQNIATSSSLVP